ncbi:ATP-binding protein [Streptantibioticus silvisoli]|uniref:PspC domain-containing protein n=1 Tax=Streptantibioticus silvisoli TaxID=2705255 RepID=A0ABT6W5W8_9ACTN|nr:ATP-binding protein [Streptantibioticus silvisoli]MDI5966150.1 PspC domain-containing protein [Streptantibioticus silvisoli]
MSATSAPFTGPPGPPRDATAPGADTGARSRPGRPGAGRSAEEEDPPRLYRSSEGRIIGGVARGLAGHLGLPVSWVRVVFVALTTFGGLSVVLYALFWFVVPLGLGGVDEGREPMGARAWLAGRKPERGQLIALAAMLGGLAILVNNLHLGAANAYIWPMLLIAAGVALVWRQADNARRARWVEMSRGKRFWPLARGAAGVILVVAGVTGFLVLQGSAEHLGAIMQASLALLVGIALLVGPYVIRITQDLSEERTLRIRAQERAEVAAHVHDSVLHTLTLIQRNADDPREVARLARAQERELRAWLYRPEGTGKEEDEPKTMADAIRAAAAEVEDRHGVPVEVVCVGDCPLTPALAAMHQAAREAMVNAAKYGGDEAVQAYAEVEEDRVFVSIRDHGPGFDPAAVPEDRMGVRESIIGRMERNGGTARIHPAPGGGTEVELEMERSSA